MTVRPINTPPQDRLAPDARLDLVAEILAQAVRRSLRRRGRFAPHKTSPEFPQERSREQLDCHAAKSVHHVPTRPRKETR